MEAESVTVLLNRARGGDAAAGDRAYALVYEQLRGAARRQLRHRRDRTLCTTALVNETWLKLAHADVDPRDREHFLALAARAMRMIVIDQARRSLAEKRGGQCLRVTLNSSLAGDERGAEDLLALDAAMARLAEADPRLAQVVEWRYFGGLTEPEVAQMLGVTDRTVRRDWRKARAFLLHEMTRSEAAP
ncbi:ECF-type sigma factor [Luteimonas sp. SX5]|uniref:ECF-type sigma factor n=1 Tax=Luteimonas galliterrae TaxID=2940486 RepID=A0ABT0MKN8_9GAMM|nr:ECF-type sigma factor [Luteimonas galliterrae]MCL1634825.1 ECF-type sigma factor [Luteimonas galliterrae]